MEGHHRAALARRTVPCTVRKTEAAADPPSLETKQRYSPASPIFTLASSSERLAKVLILAESASRTSLPLLCHVRLYSTALTTRHAKTALSPGVTVTLLGTSMIGGGSVWNQKTHINRPKINFALLYMWLKTGVYINVCWKSVRKVSVYNRNYWLMPMSMRPPNYHLFIRYFRRQCTYTYQI